MSKELTIQVNGLWKRYGIPPLKLFLALQKRGRGFKNRQDDSQNYNDTLWALKDINFQVKKGETLGVIGRNGSGKSTLLKILAGTTPPTHGRVKLEGRVFSMIELTAGVNTELTGRENVHLLGAVMGFSRKEIIQQIPAVEEFCELGDWFDRPVRTYSSGMLARLGFGTAVNVNTEVLLIDEVLAVGDVAFQKKCVNAIQKLRSQGVTTVFVSHSPYQIERICDRVLLLNEGNMLELDTPGEVISNYLELLTQFGKKENKKSMQLRGGTGTFRVTDIEYISDQGVLSDFVWSNKPLTIRLHYKTTEVINEPHISVRIIDQQNTEVVCMNSSAERKGMICNGTGFVDCKIHNLVLMPQTYYLQIRVTDGVMNLDVVYNAGYFDVKARPYILLESAGRGMIYQEVTWVNQTSLD